MSINPGMMSSKTDQWATPWPLFIKLDKEFHFTLDVCADKMNAKAPAFWTVEQDALSEDCPWEGVCWMNPPYGRQIGKWIKKAYESALGGATVVCLIPARTDTAYWHDYCMKGEIRFLRGRVKFEEVLGIGDFKCHGPAPFPSAVVIFRPPQG